MRLDPGSATSGAPSQHSDDSHGPLKSTIFAFRFLGENRQTPSVFSLESESKNRLFELPVRVDSSGLLESGQEGLFKHPGGAAREEGV